MILVPSELNQPSPGHLLIVGRDPGENEEVEGRPFVGKAGELLTRVLAETGLRREDVNITNVVPYRPPENDFAQHDPRVVEEGVRSLWSLIDRIKPILIVALGNEASAALIEGWPTRGRNLFGAKGIEDRRGYFWDTRFGTVLSTLHPAGVLRKSVPGEFLLKLDFRRARKWLAGQLPREEFPEIKRLNAPRPVMSLLRSSVVAWDIETKWNNTALLCSGYCGDDLQPYVAKAGEEFERWGKQILTAQVPKVGHNGPGFDIPAMWLFYKLRVQQYLHDTQTEWWALEPGLAGTEDTESESNEGRVSRRMTRKALAFLASMLFNVHWWKNYPEDDDPEHDEKMFILNGRDCYITKRAHDTMIQRIQTENVMAQYRMAMDCQPALIEMHLEGFPINEQLRQARIHAIHQRWEQDRDTASYHALKWIEQQDIAAFATLKKCNCCGGGKTQREHCVRCSLCYVCGVPEKITKHDATVFGYKTLKEFKASWPKCEICSATGKVKSFSFNPFAEKQMKEFLYQAIGAPKHTWKGKTTTDAEALKKVLRWARGK